MEALKMEDRVDNWNDDRLDELSRRTDEGFKEMRGGFARVDREMKEGFAEVTGEIRHLGGRMDQLADRVDRLAHALMVAGVSFGITAFATVAGLVVTQV